jgi:hypothetical protein
MIQPEGLYAAFKKAPDPMVLGRLGFALADREDELNPPLSVAERWMFETVFELNKWHSEKRESIKENWKKAKRAQRKGKGECQEDNGDVTEQTDVQTDVECPNGHSDVLETTKDNAMSDTLSIYLSNYLSNIHPNGCINSARKATDEEMKTFAKQIGAESYLDEFIRIMEGQGWAYINPAGKVVPVNVMTFKTVLGAFYRQSKRSKGNDNNSRSNRNDSYNEAGLAEDVGV